MNGRLLLIDDETGADIVVAIQRGEGWVWVAESDVLTQWLVERDPEASCGMGTGTHAPVTHLRLATEATTAKAKR